MNQDGEEKGLGVQDGEENVLMNQDGEEKGLKELYVLI